MPKPSKNLGPDRASTAPVGFALAPVEWIPAGDPRAQCGAPLVWVRSQGAATYATTCDTCGTRWQGFTAPSSNCPAPKGGFPLRAPAADPDPEFAALVLALREATTEADADHHSAALVSAWEALLSAHGAVTKERDEANEHIERVERLGKIAVDNARDRAVAAEAQVEALRAERDAAAERARMSENAIPALDAEIRKREQAEARAEAAERLNREHDEYLRALSERVEAAESALARERIGNVQIETLLDGRTPDLAPVSPAVDAIGQRIIGLLATLKEVGEAHARENMSLQDEVARKQAVIEKRNDAIYDMMHVLRNAQQSGVPRPLEPLIAGLLATAEKALLPVQDDPRVPVCRCQARDFPHAHVEVQKSRWHIFRR